MSFEGLKGAGAEFSKTNFDNQRLDAQKLKEAREKNEGRGEWPKELSETEIGSPAEKSFSVGNQNINYEFSGYNPETQSVVMTRHEANGNYTNTSQREISMAEYLLLNPEANGNAEVTLEDLMGVYDNYSPIKEAMYNNEANYELVGDVLYDLPDEDSRFAKYGTLKANSKVSLADGRSILKAVREKVFAKVLAEETDEKIEAGYNSKDSQAMAQAYSKKVRKTLFS